MNDRYQAELSFGKKWHSTIAQIYIPGNSMFELKWITMDVRVTEAMIFSVRQFLWERENKLNLEDLEVKKQSLAPEIENI